VPAALCRWGLCPRCPGVGRCLSGVHGSSSSHAVPRRKTVAHPEEARVDPREANTCCKPQHLRSLRSQKTMSGHLTPFASKMGVGTTGFFLCSNDAYRSSWQVRCWPSQDSLLLRVVCTRIKPPFTSPAHLHCSHCCNTVARPSRSIRSPLELPCACHTPYNIVNNNIV